MRLKLIRENLFSLEEQLIIYKAEFSMAQGHKCGIPSRIELTIVVMAW